MSLKKKGTIVTEEWMLDDNVASSIQQLAIKWNVSVSLVSNWRDNTNTAVRKKRQGERERVLSSFSFLFFVVVSVYMSEYEWKENWVRVKTEGAGDK